eukprot:4463024-Lingulodinium_polyedra.AAC.1
MVALLHAGSKLMPPVVIIIWAMWQVDADHVDEPQVPEVDCSDGQVQVPVNPMRGIWPPGRVAPPMVLQCVVACKAIAAQVHGNIDVGPLLPPGGHPHPLARCWAEVVPAIGLGEALQLVVGVLQPSLRRVSIPLPRPPRKGRSLLVPLDPGPVPLRLRWASSGLPLGGDLGLRLYVLIEALVDLR